MKSAPPSASITNWKQIIKLLYSQHNNHQRYNTCQIAVTCLGFRSQKILTVVSLSEFNYKFQSTWIVYVVVKLNGQILKLLMHNTTINHSLGVYL